LRPQDRGRIARRRAPGSGRHKGVSRRGGRYGAAAGSRARFGTQKMTEPHWVIIEEALNPFGSRASTGSARTDIHDKTVRPELLEGLGSYSIASKKRQ